jgi:peptidoglycan-associated lipoprotein
VVGGFATSLKVMVPLLVALACKTTDPAPTPGREAAKTPPAAPAAPGATKDGSSVAQRGGRPDTNPIGFDFDATTLSDDARERLRGIAEHMKAQPGTRLRIVGPADERGTSDYNLSLGDARARAALEYLVKLGVEKQRITVLSRGEEDPRARGHDEDAWRQNRRDEFELSAPDA